MENTIVFSKYVSSLEKDNPQWKRDPPYEGINKPIEGEKETLSEGSRDVNKLGNECDEGGGCSFSLKVNEIYGRHLTALRDITAGETVMIEPPAVIAPLVNSKTEKEKLPCITCLRKANNFLCPLCGFFLCDDKCLSLHDKQECTMLKRFNLVENQQLIHRITSKTFLEQINNLPENERTDSRRMMEAATESFFQSERARVLKFYPSLAVLKTLLLMQRNELMKGVLLSLQGIVNRATPQFRINEKVIVNTISKVLESDTDVDCIHRITAVWDTNAFEVKLSSNTFCQGIYPAASFWTHSCFPNCEQSFSEDGAILLRAVNDIPAGTILTICYTDPLWPTCIRRDHLKKTKGFDCECDRCRDPTEFNTFIGSITCENCGGYYLPSTDTDVSSPSVSCMTCRNVLLKTDVLKSELEATKALKKCSLKSVEEIWKAKALLPPKFHENHHLVLRMYISFIVEITEQNMKGVEEKDALKIDQWIKLVYRTCCKLLPKMNLLRVKVGRALIIWQHEKINRINSTPEVAQDWKLLENDVTTVLRWHEHFSHTKVCCDKMQSIDENACVF